MDETRLEQINALAAEVAALRARNDILQAEINALQAENDALMELFYDLGASSTRWI